MWITISRETKLNALNRETISELHQVLCDALGRKEVRGVVITGAGQKAFVAGADISELAALGEREGAELARHGQEMVFDLIAESTKPVIAAINGYALGGGLELAMACHVRIAVEGARLGLPELSLGLIPGYGGTQRLAELAGKGKAMEMILTGDQVKAEEALGFGLVNLVVPASELAAAANQMMAKMIARSPRAIAAAIRAVNASGSGKAGFQVEIAEFGGCFGTDDFREGTSAFLEKRKPRFSGE